MGSYVLGLEESDRSKVALFGGKGANLGELSRIEGVRVPAGFCVTTEAYDLVIGSESSINGLLERLSRLGGEDRDEIAECSAQIRSLIEATPVPEDIREEINLNLTVLGVDNAYAVRSSATAEDLPAASFAGQQDTFLNVRGPDDIFRHIRKCWASLYNERAVTYRAVT